MNVIFVIIEEKRMNATLIIHLDIDIAITHNSIINEKRSIHKEYHASQS